MVEKGAITGVDADVVKDDCAACDSCLLGKATRQPFPQQAYPTQRPLEVVACDMFGPVRVPTLQGGYTYVFSLIDLHTRYTWCYLLPNKEGSTVLAVLRKWHKQVEQETGLKFQCLRSDRGKEFVNSAIMSWLQEQGIKQQLTAPYTPQQNGVVERWHRTMAEGIRTLLVACGLPTSLWGEALRYVLWVKNRTSHSALPDSTTPCEMWTGRKADVSAARVWGCMGVVLLPDREQDGKFAPRGTFGVCLGVDEESKAWRMLDPNTGQIRISRNVDFLEQLSWAEWSQGRKGLAIKQQQPDSLATLFPLVEGDRVSAQTPQLHSPHSVPLSLPPPVRTPHAPKQTHSGDARKEAAPTLSQGSVQHFPTSSSEMSTHSREQQAPQHHEATSAAPTGTQPATGMQLLLGKKPSRADTEAGFAAAVLGAVYAGVGTGQEPRTLQEALTLPDAAEWQAGYDREVQAMKDNQVWDPELVDLPPGKKAVRVKLVFRKKTDAQGKVKEHKVRLVAKGFSQVPGQDFEETYAWVAKMTTSRVLLAHAALEGMHVEQMDVKTAFLNGRLEEEIYIQQPEGLDDGTGRVYRLRRALYGLKQAPRVWNQEIGGYLCSLGFEKSPCDDALFVKVTADVPVFVLVYVDDLLLVSPQMQFLQDVKEALSRKYSMKDLGPVNTYLGIQVKRDLEGGWLEIGQEKYVRSLECRFSQELVSTRKVTTPLAPDVVSKIRKETWSKDEREEVDPTAYRSLIGCLMYAATSTRPDLAYSVSFLAQASAQPLQIHWVAALRVLRYLVDTASVCLKYSRDSGDELVGYTDADWGSEVDGKSRAAQLFKLAGGAVSWQSKKLPGIATSTTEAEYKALSEGAKEAIWLKRLLGSLRGGAEQSVTVFCDNESALRLTKNPVLHQRSKHFKLAWHFIREAVADGDVCVEHVPTVLQDADMLTKPLSSSAHRSNMERVGLERRESPGHAALVWELVV